MQAAILDHTKSELGEGPTYDPAQDIAWWFDIEGRKLFEHDFSAGRTRQFPLPFKASMLAVVDEERQLIASESGLFLRDARSGAMTLHHPLEADKAATRSNDGRVHPCGAIWIGTMGHAAEKKAGTIHHFFNGRLTTLYREITIPNAICFSPDRRTAYFTDTMVNTIMRVRIDPATALPEGEAEPFFDQGDRKGGLDGAITDADGNVWVAVWGASCLQKISPQGDLIETFPLPVTQPSCPCFVGKDLDRLLVTSAWQGNPAAANKGEAGKTLMVDVAVKGKPEPRVML